MTSMIERAVEICTREPMIEAAYLVQLFAPASNQTTSHVLALELSGPLPPNAFAAWPADEPVVILQLNDDVWSRLIRLTKPIYTRPQISSGRRFADAIAAAVGGWVHEVPSRDHTMQYAIAIPPARRMPCLVRDFGHAFSAVIFGGRSFSVPPKADPTPVVSDVAADLRAWNPDEAPTILERAIALRDALAEALEEPWTVSIPGTLEPTEMWLHGAKFEAASIGVFGGGSDPIPRVIERARAQQAAYRSNVERGKQLEVIAGELARRLRERLDEPWPVATTGFASHDRAIGVTIGTEVALRVDGDELRGHAGLPGDDGWDARLDDYDLDDLVKAIVRARQTLQLDDLRIGARYRVIDSIQDLRVGSIVTYSLYDDIDNHYGRYVFTDEAGNECAVSGDLSGAANPLREVHRYLAKI